MFLQSHDSLGHAKQRGVALLCIEEIHHILFGDLFAPGEFSFESTFWRVHIPHIPNDLRRLRLLRSDAITRVSPAFAPCFAAATPTCCN